MTPVSRAASRGSTPDSTNALKLRARPATSAACSSDRSNVNPGASSFKHKGDARRFVDALAERLGCFGLTVHPDKTRLIEFGRFAQANRRARGQGRPETFDFLGFTHYCARNRRGGYQLGRKPVAKRVSRTLRRLKEELGRRRHRSVNETGKWLGQVLNGWLNYFAVPTSYRYLQRFVARLKRLWLTTLRRRSQKDRYSWDQMDQLVAIYWPKSTIRHPWPSQRLAVNLTQGRSRMP